MDLERAIETQRLRLLRVLAGLLAALAFLSVAPIAPAWSRWVCAWVWSVLMRAETAAQSLVLAQACVQAKRRGVALEQTSSLPCSAVGNPAHGFNAEDVPSLAVLRQRLKALQFLLKNLPRRGETLLRRMTKRAVEISDPIFACFGSEATCVLVHENQWRAPKLWHPPERNLPTIRQ